MTVTDSQSPPQFPPVADSPPPAPPVAPPAAPAVTPAQFQRAWRCVSVSAMFGTFYFTVEYLSAARVGFLAELRAAPFDFGLIAALYALAFGFQVVSGALINHLRRRKPLFIVTALVHRLLFLAVLLSPFFILWFRCVSGGSSAMPTARKTASSFRWPPRW